MVNYIVVYFSLLVVFVLWCCFIARRRSIKIWCKSKFNRYTYNEDYFLRILSEGLLSKSKEINISHERESENCYLCDLLYQKRQIGYETTCDDKLMSALVMDVWYHTGDRWRGFHNFEYREPITQVLSKKFIEVEFISSEISEQRKEVSDGWT